MENNILIILLLNIFLIHEHTMQRYDGDSCRTNEGDTGRCRLDNQCPIVFQRFRDQRIRPTICGFSGRSPIVCCPAENLSTTTTTRTTATTRTPATTRTTTFSSQPKQRISEKKCNDFKRCFVGIVNGVDAAAGEYPHMVAIGWPLANGNGYSWKCGGTLIDEKYVVTAAHCTFLESNELSSETPTIIRLGDLILNSDSDNLTPVDVPIRSIQLHPQYKPPSRYHDIALMELNNPIRITRFIKPACMWFSPELPTYTDIVTATGWGATQYMGSSSETLQKVNLTVFDQNVCRGPYPPNRRLPLSIIDQQLCAGDTTTNKDTCQGDSGGPLQTPHDTSSCGHYLIGLTSIGSNCGRNIPAIYTKISSYVDWIENIVWPGE